MCGSSAALVGIVFVVALRKRKVRNGFQHLSTVVVVDIRICFRCQVNVHRETLKVRKPLRQQLPVVHIEMGNPLLRVALVDNPIRSPACSTLGA